MCNYIYMRYTNSMDAPNITQFKIISVYYAE